MSRIARVLYTAKTRTTGGRECGASRSSDGLLDLWLATPGSDRIGTTPEQLFAAAWSASLESAIALAARQQKVVFPVGLAVEAEVDLCSANGADFLQARLSVSVPGVDRQLRHEAPVFLHGFDLGAVPDEAVAFHRETKPPRLWL